MNQKVSISKVISTDTHKVILLSGQTGDTLHQHKVDTESLLLVKSGCITYKEENQKEKVLYEGAGQRIPAEVFHEVYCNDTAEAFVVIPLAAKIKFKR